MKKTNVDISELLSRAPADPMTAAERKALTDAIAADATLAREQRAYGRLDALLSRFAKLPVDVDWDRLSGDITAEVRAEFEAAVESTENHANAFDAMHPPMPAVDWDTFRANVSNAVRNAAALVENERTIKWPAALSWAAPLAAAALIAIIVWRPIRLPETPNITPLPVVPVALVEVEFARPEASGVITVAFDDSQPNEPVTIEDDPIAMSGGTVIVNGSRSVSQTTPLADVEGYYY